MKYIQPEFKKYYQKMFAKNKPVDDIMLAFALPITIIMNSKYEPNGATILQVFNQNYETDSIANYVRFRETLRKVSRFCFFLLTRDLSRCHLIT